MKVRVWIQVEQHLGDKFERIMNHEELHEVIGMQHLLDTIQDEVDIIKSRIYLINNEVKKP